MCQRTQAEGRVKNWDHLCSLSLKGRLSPFEMGPPTGTSVEEERE